MDQSGGGSTPPPGQQTPPPPPQGWQSTPTPPGPPPGGSGFGMGSSAMPPGPIAGTTIADFITRLVAFVIDGIILNLVNFVINTVLFIPLLSLGGLYVVVYAILAVAINAVYFIYFWTTRRQTPGMMAMKLMVVQDGTGAALTQSQAIRRWMFLGLPLALSALLYAGGGLSFGLGAFVSLGILFTLATLVAIVSIGWEIYLAYTTSQDPRKQGVHDKAVDSVVIATGPSPFGQR